MATKKPGTAVARKKPKPSAAVKTVAGLAAQPAYKAHRRVAALATDPSVTAAAAMSVYIGPTVNVVALAANLEDSIGDLCAGDMKRAEAMLYAQAHVLQAIFTNLSRRARAQGHLASMEACMRLAFKAQNQCRMTLETLSTVKNPAVMFTRQANINNGGQQQVNIGVAPAGGRAPARAVDAAILPTELLGTRNGQRLDTRAQGAAGRANPQLAPVGEVHRAANRRR